MDEAVSLNKHLCEMPTNMHLFSLSMRSLYAEQAVGTSTKDARSKVQTTSRWHKTTCFGQRVSLIRALLADVIFLRLKLHALNLLRWQHLENNSVRLFRRFWDFDLIICNFFSVQRLQRFLPGT